MSKKGVSKISGNSSPKIGEPVTYTVTDWYPATPQSQRNPALVTWELFKKRSNGRFTSTNIKKKGDGTFTFGEVAQKHTYLLEAYLYEPEGSGASTIEINPQPAEVPKIEKVELQYVDDSPGTVFSFREKMRARAQCVNLNGKKLKFTLWEDDEAGEGHNAKNLLIETKEATVDRSGVATAEFMLTRALMQKAMQGEADPQKLEFYVTVEYFSNKKHATDNVSIDNPLHSPAPIPQSRPQQPVNNSPAQQTSETPSNNTQPRAENSPAAEKPESQMEERGVAGQNANPNEELHDYQEAQGTIEAQQPPTPQSNEGKTVSVVNDSSVEELMDAYFAKKEYTKQTGEVAGTLDYEFARNGNKTGTDAEKENIAKIILGKPAVKALASKKEYTTLEAIKQVLTKATYNKDEKITFQTFKLEAEFKKVNSAPLDTKLYLVAKTAGSGLNDKEATIIIREKDGLIKGSADAVLPILEITEEQMDQAAPATGEVPGTEKSEFTGKIENGMVKIPVHLRPKSEDDLKEWREKLDKGKEDGDYTYKFGGSNNITNEDDKKRIAGIIQGNVKKGNANNTKLEEGKIAHIDEIVKVLEIKNYTAGNTITFKLYKKQPELLYLNVKAQGEKQHDKNFLKADGAYFEVGSECGCLIDEEFFFTNYQTEFPKKDKSGNEIPLSESVKTSLKKMFRSIAEYYKNEDRCCDKKQIAYLLATAKHETGDTFNPVEEANWLSWNARKKYFEEMYDPVLGKNEKRRSMALSNENTVQGDGEKYFGRGYVQLTWKKNYRRMKEKFGVDFVNDRDKAAEHEWAMKILIYGSEEGIFTGKSLSDYIKGETADYVNARRVINGTDMASTIAGYAEKIEKCLKIECNCDDDHAEVKDGYDIDKAVNYVNTNAESASIGKCALYVRKAINEGGITGLSGHANEYYDTDKLVAKGFTKVGTDIDSITLKKGDIAAFGAVKGHSYGHIAMWNGTEWVSDFKQKSFWVANQYSIDKKYAIYRWE
ncbi:glycoside hydrolase family 19 protein [Chryseobacterium terrae]|uniref:Glycoside hydrolase family 19 protein n=1 Tax=Chryseobacterium terrae TaxID=3163299 RepID=A0ABW8Y2K4_9FLAO